MYVKGKRKSRAQFYGFNELTKPKVFLVRNLKNVTQWKVFDGYK